MAGHSKWANIKHRKGAQDAKRSKLFSKLVKGVTVAAKQGGGDLDNNASLRLAVDKAKAGGVPKDTIKKAIDKACGSGEGDNFETVVYEGYGPNGVAVMVECATDNRNRTAAEVRHAFTKCGGNLGTDGSVSYLFNKQGLISYEDGGLEEKIMEIALEAQADDIRVNDDGTIDVITTVDNYLTVKDALIAAELEPQQAEVTWIAETEVELDADNASKILKLIDMLEDSDDVQNVYSNANIPDDILEQLA